MKQIDRLLTHGGYGDWLQKLARLSLYYEAAQPQISILAGGGLDHRRIEAIAANTKIREFHVGRAARFQSQVDGAVKSELVSSLVQIISRAAGRN
jgi:copper homeostasis protein CutC